MTLVLRVGGVQDCISAFRDLPRSVRNKNLRIAMNAGAGVIRDAAAANVSSSSGLLKKSLKIKVRVPDASYNSQHHGRPAYAVIGPARSVTGRVAIITRRERIFTKAVNEGDFEFAADYQAALKGQRKGQFRVSRKTKVLTTRQAIKRSFGGGGFVIRRPSRYAHLVEKGTRPHGIAAKNAGGLADGGGKFFGKSVKHPGSKPQSFLGKAVRSSGAAAQQKILRKLHDGIANWAAVRSARVRSKVGA